MVFEIGGIIAPMVVIIIVVGILANILDKQGVPFSTHPIKPDFAKINELLTFTRVNYELNLTLKSRVKIRFFARSK